MRIAEVASGEAAEVAVSASAAATSELRETALRLLAERDLPLLPEDELAAPDVLERIVYRLADSSGGASRDQARRLLDLVELSRD